MSIRGAVKVGLAAGLIAGLVLGLYIFFVMESLIDVALAYEEGEEPVPRWLAKSVALAGGVVTGLLVGIPFALVFPMVNAALPWRSVLRKAWVYGALGFIIFSFLPLLAVPGAPPGVERNLSVEEREFWYVTTMLSAFGGLLAGYGFYRIFSPNLSTPRSRHLLLAASLGVIALLWTLPFLLKPEITFVPGDVPVSFLQLYTAMMFLQWVIFWGVLSTALGLLWTRFESTPASSGAQATA
jgi:predicted cobalt transporter CbtA